MISKSELQMLAVELFDIGVIKPGTPKTPIYIDFQQLIFHPQSLARLSLMLWSLADTSSSTANKYDKICGVPYAASTRCGLAYTALTYAYQISSRVDVPMLMRRRSAPTSCSGVVEGPFERGERVVIVDDEIGNGSNVLEVAVDLVKEGLKIGEALVVVDREQGGRENLDNAGIRVKSLFGFRELIGYLRDAGRIPAVADATAAALRKFTVAPTTSSRVRRGDDAIPVGLRVHSAYRRAINPRFT